MNCEMTGDLVFLSRLLEFICNVLQKTTILHRGFMRVISSLS